MAYSKPNSFTNGQPLTAASVKGNDEALKVYLHEGVVSGDLKASAWVDTEHIQAPALNPFIGVQHGITGFQGSQWDGGVLVRAQFGTALLTGKRYGSTTKNWEVIPQTTFGIKLRAPATVMFHWWMESNNGPDNGDRTLGSNAYMWVTEYNNSGLLSGIETLNVTTPHALEVKQNAQGYVGTNPPAGPLYPYTLQGYGNMSGTKVIDNATGTLAVGLAHLSTIDRSVMINWGINIEAYYLK
tara:strand:- start:580 stop:1302 length:723 start_codon:yes stop_codon:yes gene_type:complete